MIANSQQPLGDTEVVSGHAVRRSPLEGVAKLAQAGVGAYKERQADDAEANLANDIEARKKGEYEKLVEAIASDGSEYGNEEDPQRSRENLAKVLAGMGDYDNAVKLKLADVNSRDPNKAPTVKDFYENGQVVQKQWDPTKQSWVEMGC